MKVSSKWFADRQLNFLLDVNVLVVIVATWLSHGQFLDIDNLQSMGGQLPELGLLALGIMLSMVSGNGGIDLSGVGLANLSGMVAAMRRAAAWSPPTIRPRSIRRVFCVHRRGDGRCSAAC